MEAATLISSPLFKNFFEVVNNVAGAMMIDGANFLPLCQCPKLYCQLLNKNLIDILRVYPKI